jgi:hypothetical protein
VELSTGPDQLVLTGVHLEPCEPSFAQVRIRIRDAQGSPAGGVRLYLASPAGYWADATTDAAGEAVFDAVPTGAYEFGIPGGEMPASGAMGFGYIHRGDTLEVFEGILPAGSADSGPGCGDSGGF